GWRPSTRSRGSTTASRTRNWRSWPGSRCGPARRRRTCARSCCWRSTPGWPFRSTARRSPRRLQADADGHGLVDEGDAERLAHAVADLTGEGEQVGGGGAAPVGKREGVLAGDAGGSGAVALGEPGLVDQPGRG